MGHIAKDCLVPKQESTGNTRHALPANAKAIRSEDPEDPLSCLMSNSESEEETDTVKTVRVVDEGSRSQKARVIVGGVPLWGIVDSGADITIMGSSAFKQVASVAKLKKRDFKNPDKVPRNYDRQPFYVDGKINIDIEFQGKTMKTPVYIKMDAPESLLLSEGVCRQLDIITYHSEVQGGGSIKNKHEQSSGDKCCTVPTVRVRLVQDVRGAP